jgi:indolepyruvate ferredoxin oxidoreductase beta subunit
MVNTCPIVPSSLQSAGRPYPPLDSLLGPIEETAGSVLRVDASALAEEAGSFRCLNVVMLGLLAGSRVLPIAADRMLTTILAAGLPAFVEVNRRAFELGAEFVEKSEWFKDSISGSGSGSGR